MAQHFPHAAARTTIITTATPAHLQAEPHSRYHYHVRGAPHKKQVSMPACPLRSPAQRAAFRACTSVFCPASGGGLKRLAAPAARIDSAPPHFPRRALHMVYARACAAPLPKAGTSPRQLVARNNSKKHQNPDLRRL